jgi:hypothetical protein
MPSISHCLVVAALFAACGSRSQVPAPCSAIEGVRPQIREVYRETLDDDEATKQHPAEQRAQAADAIVSEVVSTCVAGHWTQRAVDCLVDAFKDPKASAATSPCAHTPEDKLMSRAFHDAEDRVITRVFGPRKPDALEEFSARWDRFEQRKASRDEPRVPIPARYDGLGWFAGKSGPMLQMLNALPGGRPACLERVLSSYAGYYQTHSLHGDPSLIALLGMLDRDPAEACLQEIAARLVPSAKLERDGALTTFTTGKPVGYLGWAADGSVYWSPDRAMVAEAVAQTTSIRSNPDVMALVAGTDHTKPTWFVLSADATSKLIGVPSTGVRFATDLLAGNVKFTAATAPRIPLTLDFASPADARRAIAALRAPHPTLSPALAAQIAKLAPVATGPTSSALEIDIAPIFSRPELVGELQAAVARLAKP